jgi:hypothetical protein
MAVGAYLESSAATGIDGDDTDRSAMGAGAVYVFVRSGPSWRQEAYVKASNTDAGDQFGSSVALSSDGSTLAVGAFHERSAARGVGGDQASNTVPFAGAAYVFTRDAGVWSQQAYLKASNTGASTAFLGDQFGASVALSGDGSTLAVGAPLEDSAATGIDGNALDTTAPGSGAVFVFARSGTAWAQQAYVKASNTNTGDGFGGDVALSADGATLAVGAFAEDGVASRSGAVYTFARTGTAWAQEAYLKASNPGAEDFFGAKLALSADASTLAVSAITEDGPTEAVRNQGAVYVFARTGATWTEEAYLHASNPSIDDELGYDLAISANGSALAATAVFEDSAATGVDGDQTSEAASQSGAAYLFRRTGTQWAQHRYLKSTNTDPLDNLGIGVAMSGDGATLAVSSYTESSAATGIDGDQTDNSIQGAGAVYVFH